MIELLNLLLDLLLFGTQLFDLWVHLNYLFWGRWYKHAGTPTSAPGKP